MKSTFSHLIDETRQFLYESSQELQQHAMGQSFQEPSNPLPQPSQSSPSKKPHYLTSFLYKKSSLEKKQQEIIEERRLQRGQENPVVNEVMGLDQFVEGEQKFYLAQFTKPWGRLSLWHKKNRLIFFLETSETSLTPEQTQQIRNHIDSATKLRATKKQITYNETQGILLSVNWTSLFPSIDN